MEIRSGLVSLIFKFVGIGIGGSSGEGVLSYQGRDYPFTISGLNLGDIGVTTVVLANEGKESGTRFSLGASGVNIKMK